MFCVVDVCVRMLRQQTSQRILYRSLVDWTSLTHPTCMSSGPTRSRTGSSFQALRNLRQVRVAVRPPLPLRGKLRGAGQPPIFHRVPPFRCVGENARIPNMADC